MIETQKRASFSHASDYHRARVITWMATSLFALVVSSVFGVSQAIHRAVGGKPAMSVISLQVNGQPVRFESAYAYAALDGTPNGSVRILAGEVNPYLSIKLPTGATSLPQMTGQTLHSTNAPPAHDANDTPNILYLNERRYIPERASATVLKASNNQMTLTLDASLREEGKAAGQGAPSFPLTGTITVNVWKR